MGLICLAVNQCLKIFDLPADCDNICLVSIVRLAFYLEPFSNKLIFGYKKSRAGLIIEEPLRRSHMNKILGYTKAKLDVVLPKLFALNVLAQDSRKHFFINPKYIRVENDESCSDTLNLFKIKDTRPATKLGSADVVRQFVKDRKGNAVLTCNEKTD